MKRITYVAVMAVKATVEPMTAVVMAMLKTATRKPALAGILLRFSFRKN